MANILKVWDEATQQYVGIPALKGESGETPNLAIGTVQTLDAGSNATASIGGTAKNPILNLGIPKGSNGSVPVKGVDYWTEDDKEEIVQEVSETFPTSLPANGGNADTVSGHTVGVDVPANAKFTDTVYTHPGSGTNPHGTTKSDVGLGNVGNFKAVSTVASQELSNQEKTNARNNIGAGTSSFSGNYADLSGTPTIPTTLPASDVSEWAKQPNKPTYTASEVGARPNTWTPNASDVGAIPSSLKSNYDAAYTHSTSSHAPVDAQKNVQADWNATSGDAFIKNKPTSMPASDVSSWAKAANKPTYTASEVGAHPSTWTPTASDVGAIPSSSKSNYDAAYTHSTSSHAPSNAQKNVQSDWNATSGDAMILNKPTSMPASDVSDWAKAATKPSYTASEVGARSNTWMPTAANVGAIATSARGAANGVASLGSNSKIPVAQLPISVSGETLVIG